MPKKTKETIIKENKKEPKDTKLKKVSSTTAKAPKKETKSTKAKVTKSSSTKTTKKSVTTKKTAKKTSKKVSSKKTTKKEKESINFSPEYYDLPYKYNQTVVKILAQTPNTLFIYWEISDEDRQNLKKQYGKYFFEITKPVLIVTNLTMNYSFEVDIDDFANSWYLHVNDSNSQYQIELGRRPISINYSYIPDYNIEKDEPIKPVEQQYIYISSSNRLESPNDRILFNNTNKIYFKNIKTNSLIIKDISEFPNIYKDNKFVNLAELYQHLYRTEIFNSQLDLNNPSSGNPSSGIFSIKYK